MYPKSIIQSNSEYSVGMGGGCVGFAAMGIAFDGRSITVLFMLIGRSNDAQCVVIILYNCECISKNCWPNVGRHFVTDEILPLGGSTGGISAV